MRVCTFFKYLPQVALEAVTIAHPDPLSLSWDEPTRSVFDIGLLENTRILRGGGDKDINIHTMYVHILN